MVCKDISNCVLYSLLAISSNLKYVRNLSDSDAEIVNSGDVMNVFGVLMLNALDEYNDRFKHSTTYCYKEGVYVVGKLNMEETMRRQSLSKGKIVFTDDKYVINYDVLGVIKHTLMFLVRRVKNSKLRSKLMLNYSLLNKVQTRQLSINAIRSKARVMKAEEDKMILLVCALVREHLEFMTSSKSDYGNIINDSRIMGYLFENYLKDVANRYKKYNSNLGLQLLESSGVLENTIMKYDVGLYSDDIVVIGEVKCTSNYLSNRHLHQIRDYIFSRLEFEELKAGDNNNQRTVIGVLIYAKSRRGFDESDIDDLDFNVLTKEKRHVELYRENKIINLGVNTIKEVDIQVFKLFDAYFKQDYRVRAMARQEVN